MPVGSEAEPPAEPPAPTKGGGTGGQPAGVPPQAEGAPVELEAERMPPRSMEAPPRHAAVRTAWAVAIVTDALQWILWPMFAGGIVSPFNDVVDVVAAAILVKLLGWHWAFLPAFLAEIIPGVDLVPTWTAAVFLATRGAKRDDASRSRS